MNHCLMVLMFYYYEVPIKLSIPQHASVAKFNDLQGGLILGKNTLQNSILELNMSISVY